MILAIFAIAVGMAFLAIFLFTISAKPPVVTQDSYWILESYHDATGILIPVIDNTEVTARFGDDGILSGTAGCNRYSAAYLVRGKQLAITPPRVQTQLSCLVPGIMEQESAFLADLPSAASLQTGGTKMKVLNNESRVILSFRQG
jgi:heat shock protein HslJ